MKLFIVLCVLVVSSLADELNFNRNSNDNVRSRSRITPFSMQEEEPNQHIRSGSTNNRNSLNAQYDSNEHQGRQTLNGRTYVDSNGLTSEALRELFQSARQVEQNRNSNSNPSEDSSLGYWASYPDAAAFDAKVKARLGSSRVLANKPDIRQKVIQLAEEKFNICKGKIADEERACLARSTGQVMQLVAAVENMARNQ